MTDNQTTKAIDDAYRMLNKGPEALWPSTLEQAMCPDAAEIRRAVIDYMKVVEELFKIRGDGPCLAERSPSRDTECLEAFQRLDATGKALKAVVERLSKEQAP